MQEVHSLNSQVETFARPLLRVSADIKYMGTHMLVLYTLPAVRDPGGRSGYMLWLQIISFEMMVLCNLPFTSYD